MYKIIEFIEAKNKIEFSRIAKEKLKLNDGYSLKLFHSTCWIDSLPTYGIEAYGVMLNRASVAVWSNCKKFKRRNKFIVQ